MSIFGSIMSKIFGHSAEAAPAGATPSGSAAGGSAAGGATTASTSAGGAAAAGSVDVEHVMKDLAAKSGQPSNWRTSIVDTMKLLGLDSSLQNRKELAKELGYTGDMNDSASMNIWLQKQVFAKLAQNGGKVPDDLKHA